MSDAADGICAALREIDGEIAKLRRLIEISRECEFDSLTRSLFEDLERYEQWQAAAIAMIGRGAVRIETRQ